MKHQHIACDVRQCKYNADGSACSLNNIQVSATDNNPNEKDDTGCMSFDCC